MVDAFNGLSDGWGLKLTKNLGCDGIHEAEKNQFLRKVGLDL